MDRMSLVSVLVTCALSKAHSSFDVFGLVSRFVLFGPFDKSQCRVKKGEWEAAKVDGVELQGKLRLNVISLQKIVFAFDYSELSSGKDKDHVAFANLQSMVANLLDKKLLDSARRLSDFFVALESIAPLIIRLVTKLQTPTKDDAKSFSLTCYDNYTFEEIVNESSNMALLIRNKNSLLIAQLPFCSQSIFHDVILIATKIGSKFHSKVKAEMVPSKVLRDSVSDGLAIVGPNDADTAQMVKTAMAVDVKHLHMVAACLSSLAALNLDGRGEAALRKDAANWLHGGLIKAAHAQMLDILIQADILGHVLDFDSALPNLPLDPATVSSCAWIDKTGLIVCHLRAIPDSSGRPLANRVACSCWRLC